MLPSLKPRQHVLSIATKKIKKDDLVIIKDSSDNKLIKRVSWIDNEKIKLISDNKNYPSSKTENIFDSNDLVGKVICLLYTSPSPRDS